MPVLRDQGFAKETGGLSGRPLFARATRMLARVYQLTQGKLPLIGVGGIDSGEAALAKIEAGASLLQLYTGLVFEGPGLIGRIKQALIEAMAKDGSADARAADRAARGRMGGAGVSHDASPSITIRAARNRARR